MEEIKLPTKKFYVTDLQNHYKNGLLKDHLDAINYINQYYFEISNGDYYYYNGNTGKFEFKEKKQFTNEVLVKVENHKDIVTYYKLNSRIFSIVQEFDKPQLYQIENDYFINVFPMMLHKEYKNYNDYDEDTKRKVEIFISYLREVSCNNNEKMLKALLLYYAQIARCMKTKVVIVKKTTMEGSGKSTEFDFISKYVFGDNLCIRCSVEPLLSNYNKILQDKILVLFEELPTFTKEQWMAVNSKIKTYATEDTYQFRDPYEKPLSLQHRMNIQINGNVESIKQYGRRIIFMDINCSKTNDIDFFDNLRKNCFNLQVGEAFYSYLRTFITDEQCSKFYGQNDFPLTENKLEKLVENLKPTFKFCRDEYLSKNIPIKLNKIELYTNFTAYCSQNNIKYEKKTDFYSQMREIGATEERTADDRFFVLGLDMMKKVATRDNWYEEKQDYETAKPVSGEPSETVADHCFEAKSDKSIFSTEYQKLLLKYKTEIDELIAKKETAKPVSGEPSETVAKVADNCLDHCFETKPLEKTADDVLPNETFVSVAVEPKPISKRKKVIVKNAKLDDKIVKNEEQFIEEFSNLIN